MRHGIVTTGANPDATSRARAAQVAALLGVPVVRRSRSLARTLDDAGAGFAYVVSRAGEHIASRTQRLAVDAGLTHAKVAAGATHPLIRAVGPCARVIDGTLGLAGDALHLSAALGAEVHAAELSPWVATLTRAGLAGLADGPWGEAASRVHVHAGSAASLLAERGAADAVFFAPMFVQPAAAAPGFDLFRALAAHAPLDADTFALARRVAPVVVVRVERGAPAPFPGMRPIRGKAVDYWVAGRPASV